MKMPFLLLIFTFFGINLHVKRNYFKNPNKIETKQYSLFFKDAVATEEECKVAVLIENKTNDIFMLKHNESTFNIREEKINAKEKSTYIYPHLTGKKVLRIVGGSNYLVDNFKLNFKGLYVISTSGNVQKVKNFQLPAKTNQITAGDFVISLLKLKQKTQETVATFECKYMGSNYGIIQPSKLSVIAKDKQGKDVEYANDYKNNKIRILKQGKSTKFTAIFHINGRVLDMQFSTLFVKWNDTFSTSISKELQDYNVTFELNSDLTKEKN